MQNRRPSVSVIIPTFNRASFVVDAISSCLFQNIPSQLLEIVVVDDGSTDATGPKINRYADRIRYLPFHINRGRNKARNAGLAVATGDYVKFLDSDDVLESGSLNVELATAHAAGADMVLSGWQLLEIGSRKTAIRFAAPRIEPVIDGLLAGRAVPTGAALYLRSMIGDMRWDEGLRKLDDWDWFIRAALRAKKVVRADVISYSWREHPGQGIRNETMLLNAQEHHIILRKLEAALNARGELTISRRKRLAQYYYKEMRVLCLHDKTRFEWGVRHIYELDPKFVPKDEERQ